MLATSTEGVDEFGKKSDVAAQQTPRELDLRTAIGLHGLGIQLETVGSGISVTGFGFMNSLKSRSSLAW